MKYSKHSEDPDIRHRIIIRGRDGNIKEGAIEYDPELGWGKRIVDQEKQTIQDYYEPGGTVEVDDVSNPDEFEYKALKKIMKSSIVKQKDPELHRGLMRELIDDEKQKEIDKDKPKLSKTTNIEDPKCSS